MCVSFGLHRVMGYQSNPLEMLKSILEHFGTFESFEWHFTYSRVSNESTGTLKKTQPKIQAVRNFLCGTIEGNSRFCVTVLLFHSPYSTAILENWKSKLVQSCQMR